MKIINIIVYILLYNIIIVFINSQTPFLYPGFPKKIDSLRLVSSGGNHPLITDLERDGQKEIVIGTSDYNFSYGSMIYAIESDGAHQVGFPKFIPQYRIRAYASGDIDGNGYLEVVVRTDSLMYVFDRFGNNIPGFPVTSNLATSYFSPYFVSLYDLDNDGKLEIITNFTNGITVFNWNGTTRAGWPVSFGNSRPSYNCAVGDIDNDGYGEIVISTAKITSGQIDSSHLRVLRHNGSNLGWNWPVSIDSGYNANFFGGPSLYKDSYNMHIILFTGRSLNHFLEYQYRFTKYSSTGEIIELIRFHGYDGVGATSIGNVLGHDTVEFVNGVQGREHVRLYNNRLNLLKQFDNLIGAVYVTPVIGRFTYSAEINILGTGGAHYPQVNYGLWAYKPDGSYLPWSPLKATGYERRFHGFSVADINNDGSVEIIGTIDSSASWGSINTAHLYVWTVPGVPYSKTGHPWPMYGHDRYRTFQYGFTPPDEPIGIQPINQNIPKEFKLHQNYPNPFNPFTNIRFDVPKTTYVSLVIYDVLGREISRPVSEELKAGEYRISWDAGKYSSGIYFYRLIADGYTYTRKMIVAR